MRPRNLCCLALIAVAAAGCRLGVSAEVDVARDGSGTATVVMSLDAALLGELDDLGVDPSAELTAVAATDPDWQLTREAADDETLVLTLRRDAASPDELTGALRDLTAGLADRDPALVVDLDLDVDDEGAADLTGTVELRTPIGPGVVTDDAAAEDLARLAAETVEATLVVSLPGDIRASDADEVDGSTLTWVVEPGATPRTVTATAAAPTGWPVETLVAGVAALVLLVSAAVIAVVLRRRRRGVAAG